jgi:flagellar biosynthetic protein FliS
MSRRSQHIDLYVSVQRDADLLSGSKLKMIQVLFEDLCASLSAAQGHGTHQATERKNQSLTRAQRTLKGLQMALGQSAQPTLASKLSELYHYMGARLWQAHVHGDHQAIAEVLVLTRILADAWMKLSPTREMPLTALQTKSFATVH